MATDILHILYALLAISSIYFIYSALTFLYDIHRRGNYVNKLPGWDGHWLFGQVYNYRGSAEESLAFFREKVAQYPRLMTQ